MSTATNQLYRELNLLGARKVILSTNIELRLDGLPYSNRRAPQDSGAAVYFDLRGKATVLACDRWNKVEHNVWAIVKHIEALRGQQRWGVGSVEQAFAGYAQLEAKTEPSCWDILGIPAFGATADTINAVFRVKAKSAHPDLGGSSEEFQKLNQARDTALQVVNAH